MQYLSFEEYTQKGGELPSTAFSQYLFDAQSYIDLYTNNRISKMKEIPEEVKLCTFKLIDLYEQQDSCLTTSDDNRSIYSQANDGVSITYHKLSPAQKLAQIEKSKKQVLKLDFK